MGHFFAIMPAPPHEEEFTKLLHDFGGEWECDAGAFFMLHVPLVHRVRFQSETGFRLDEEVFGGIASEQSRSISDSTDQLSIDSSSR